MIISSMPSANTGHWHVMRKRGTVFNADVVDLLLAGNARGLRGYGQLTAHTLIGRYAQSSTHKTSRVLANGYRVQNVRPGRPRRVNDSSSELKCFLLSYRLAPRAASSHPASSLRSSSLRIPWPSIGTPTGEMLYGWATAMAEGYVQSSTMNISPGLASVRSTRDHLFQR